MMTTFLSKLRVWFSLWNKDPVTEIASLRQQLDDEVAYSKSIEELAEQCVSERNETVRRIDSEHEAEIKSVIETREAEIEDIYAEHETERNAWTADNEKLRSDLAATQAQLDHTTRALNELITREHLLKLEIEQLTAILNREKERVAAETRLFAEVKSASRVVVNAGDMVNGIINGG